MGEHEAKTAQEPLILEVKGNSLDDGPGIRTVIFFKGCPLDCVWCHNPEAKRAGEELSFDANECIACDTCVKVCEAGALDRHNPGYVDRAKCTLCFRCVKSCPAEALTRVGRRMSVQEIMELVLEDMPFFKTSGGGVTLSGGEPLLHMDYASQLLEGLEGHGIHTLVETSGLFNLERFDRLIYPHTDVIYFDLKLMNNDEHMRFCGVSNLSIQDNFRELFARSLAGGTPLLPRVPLIPGITATDRNLTSIAGFLRENGADRVALLAYNPLWMEKNAKIGLENRFASREEMNHFMSAEAMEHCRALFAGFQQV